jgi:hypothetical protein
MDVRFGTWTVKSVGKAGSLKTAARQLAKYVTSSGNIKGQMGQGWQSSSRQLLIFPCKWEC